MNMQKERPHFSHFAFLPCPKNNHPTGGAHTHEGRKSKEVACCRLPGRGGQMSAHHERRRRRGRVSHIFARGGAQTETKPGLRCVFFTNKKVKKGFWRRRRRGAGAERGDEDKYTNTTTTTVQPFPVHSLANPRSQAPPHAKPPCTPPLPSRGYRRRPDPKVLPPPPTTTTTRRFWTWCPLPPWRTSTRVATPRGTAADR